MPWVTKIRVWWVMTHDNKNLKLYFGKLDHSKKRQTLLSRHPKWYKSSSGFLNFQENEPSLQIPWKGSSQGTDYKRITLPSFLSSCWFVSGEKGWVVPHVFSEWCGRKRIQTAWDLHVSKIRDTRLVTHRSLFGDEDVD